MAKDKSKEEYVGMDFPLFGIDLSAPYAEQRAGTTPEGENVVGYEPTSGRLRGGTRPGLLRYLDDQLVGPIQHLNFVVSTDVNALAAAITSPPPPPIIYGGAEPGNPGIEDPSTNNGPLPRNPGRRVRDGGNGVTPNRNIPAASPPPPPPPGTNRFQIKTSLNPKPDGPGDWPATPELDPAGGGAILASRMEFQTDSGTFPLESGLAANLSFLAETGDLAQSSSSSALQIPTSWIRQQQGLTGGSGTQGGFVYGGQYQNTTAMQETAADWEDLKASLAGDLRVLFIDRTVDKDIDLDVFFAGFGETGLGSYTLPDLNVTTMLASIFGTAIDKVDYTPIAYGDNIPGSPDYIAGQIAEAAAIAAWEAIWE